MGNPLPLNLAQECRKAEKILAEFVDPVNGGLDRVIPMSVLRRAQGLAIFSVARLGFLMSARAGSGVVVARLQDDSWSAPSALGLGGVGAGFNAGLDVTDFVIVLNNKNAVRSFMATGSLQLGGNLSVAVGPLGRAAEASGAVNSSGNVAAMFSYSKSKGLYGGVSVEGTILIDRSDANSKAYHRSVTAKQILSGSTEIPDFSAPLISLIEKYTLTGQLRSEMDGTSASARGYGNYDEFERDEMGDLNRQFSETGFSERSSYSGGQEWKNGKNYSPSDPFTGRENGYAFGSGSRGSITNSPTKTRKSHFDNGTDYGKDELNGGGLELPYTANSSKYSGRNSSSNDTFARSGVQPKRSTSSPFAYDHGENARIRARDVKGFSNFPTKFERADTDDEDDRVRKTNSYSTRDPFDIGEEVETFNEPRARVSPLSSRRDKHDQLDIEINGHARRQYQSQQADLIDLSGGDEDDLQQSSAYSRRRPRGMDSLDEELQQKRESLDSYGHEDDRYSYQKTRTKTATAGWRSDFGLPDDDYAAPPPPTRPAMHQRTSSAQKLWSRVRGNSQSSKTSAFAEAWEARQSANPSPRPYSQQYGSNGGGGSRSGSRNGSRNGGGSNPSPGPYSYSSSSTPPPSSLLASSIGRTGSSTPTTGLYRSTPPISVMVEVQVLAQFDFIGQEEHDLSFKRGDVIDILKKTENREDWWLGRSADGRIGNLPANYTTDI